MKMIVWWIYSTICRARRRAYSYYIHVVQFRLFGRVPSVRQIIRDCTWHIAYLRTLRSLGVSPRPDMLEKAITKWEKIKRDMETAL